MSRPVEIDRDRAFRRAYRLFWLQGYQATSLNQLLKTLDIGRSSFYAAFGSKEALFRMVIERYCEQAQETFDRLRANRRGLDVIRGFIDETLVDISDRKRRMGCLAVNSVLELAGVDGSLQQAASDMLEELRVVLDRELIEAKEMGEIHPGAEPAALSQLLLTMFQGLRVASRRGLTREQAAASRDALFDLVKASPA